MKLFVWYGEIGIECLTIAVLAETLQGAEEIAGKHEAFQSPVAEWQDSHLSDLDLTIYDNSVGLFVYSTYAMREVDR